MTGRLLPRSSAVVAAVVLAFYAWTAATSDDLGRWSGRVDPMNRQAEAFVHGHLALRVRPPAALLRLRDPYDPGQNLRVLPGDQRDLTLYHGRYYTYWGPAAALTGFVPAHVFGADMPPGLAVLLFCAIAFACSAALVRLLVRRFVPEAPGALMPASTALLGLASVLPFALRSPEAYEASITAGAAYLMAGLLLLARGVLGERVRLGSAAAGSLCLGLAFAARAPLLLGAVFPVVALVWLWRGRRAAPRGERLRIAAALLGPLAACCAAVAAYNAIRFGSPGEVGLRYTLTGFDIRHDLNSPSFLPPGLWYYVLQPLRPRIAFPFLWLGPPPYYPGSIPADYQAPERVAGLLWTLPLVLALPALPWALRGHAPLLRRVALLAALVGVALLVVPALVQPVATQRYEIDGLNVLLPTTLLVWIALVVRASGRLRGLTVGVAAVLAAWACLVGVAVSLVGYHGELRLRHPGTWDALEGFFAPVSTLAAKVAGRPLIAAVDHDAVDPRPWSVTALAIGDTSLDVGHRGVTLQVIAPGDRRALLTARVARGDQLAPGTRATLVVSGNGRRALVTADGRVERIAVTLHSGRNELRLAARLRGSATGPDRLLRLSGVRLR